MLNFDMFYISSASNFFGIHASFVHPWLWHCTWFYVL